MFDLISQATSITSDFRFIFDLLVERSYHLNDQPASSFNDPVVVFPQLLAGTSVVTQFIHNLEERFQGLENHYNLAVRKIGLHPTSINN